MLCILVIYMRVFLNNKNVSVLDDLKGEFIQQILENVLTPLKEILDDPEADGVELALDTVEAAMSEASR